MRAKQQAETRRAQLVECAVLLVAVVWSAWLASDLYPTFNVDTTAVDTANATLLQLLPRVLQALSTVAIVAIAHTLFVPRTNSKRMDELSRPERDNGLAVGCILPPLVLLSRFLVTAYDPSGSSSTVPTLLYAWIAVSTSASFLIKTLCFGSSGVLPTVVVDVVFLPIALNAMGVESDLQFVVPIIARVVVAFVFRFGRLALRRSFTVGEALIVAQIIGLGVVDLVLVTTVKMSRQSTWLSVWCFRSIAAWDLHASPLTEREPHQLALQVGVVGALLVCVALTRLLRLYGSSSPQVVSPPLPLTASLQFVATIGFVLGGVVYPWSASLLDTSNPLTWLVEFLLETPVRLYLVVYWILCLVVCVPAFAVVSRVLALRQIIARKLFHALVVIMFVPAYFHSAEMLSLSYGVAFAVFCLAECVRALSLPPFGQHIAAFVQPFIDHREGGRVILTHTYLLLGCALPLWLAHSTAPSNALAANAGVLALGVGDAMGAAVGSTFGRRKVFGSKTIEGTVAVLISTTIASLALHGYHTQTLIYGDVTQLLLVLFGSLLTSLLELATAQIDNLVLSLFLFTVANLVSCHI